MILKTFKSENSVVAIDVELTVTVHNLLFSLQNLNKFALL